MNCRSRKLTDRRTWTVAIRSCVALAAWWALVWGVAAARACNTPVFRYAMDNWAPAPYYVFYLHRGGEAEEDKRVNQTLSKLAEDAPAVANLAFLPVDVAEKRQVDRLGELVNKLWQKDHGGKVPMHLVLSPRGADLFAGRLKPAAIKAMISSPARTRLGKLFEEGHAAVLLMLPGSDAKANSQAEKVAGRVAAQASSGELAGLSALGPVGFPATLPPQAPGAAPAGDGAGPPSATLKVAMLKVSRTDPAEQWLIRSLTAIEPDLHELAKEPMVFTVFGRARALEPCVGKGINEDNLSQDIAFLTGPCSCMVKEQNPGVDLLLRWDWEATAIATSDQWADGGGQLAYQEFVPGPEGQWVPSSAPQSTAQPVSIASPGSTASDQTPSAAAAGKQTASAGTEAVAADAGQRQKSEVAPGERGRDADASASFAVGQMWKLGIGFALATIVVLVAGFLFVRRQ